MRQSQEICDLKGIFELVLLLVIVPLTIAEIFHIAVSCLEVKSFWLKEAKSCSDVHWVFLKKN